MSVDFERVRPAFRVLGEGKDLESARKNIIKQELWEIFQQVYDNYDNPKKRNGFIDQINDLGYQPPPNSVLASVFETFQIWYPNEEFRAGDNPDVSKKGYDLGAKMLKNPNYLNKALVLDIIVWLNNVVSLLKTHQPGPLEDININIKYITKDIENLDETVQVSVTNILQKYCILDKNGEPLLIKELNQLGIFLKRYLYANRHLIMFAYQDEANIKKLEMEWLKEEANLCKDLSIVKKEPTDKDIFLLRGFRMRLTELEEKNFVDVPLDIDLSTSILKVVQKYSKSFDILKNLAKIMKYWNTQDDELKTSWEGVEVETFPKTLMGWNYGQLNTYKIPVQNNTVKPYWYLYEVNKLKNLVHVAELLLTDDIAAILIFASFYKLYENTLNSQKILEQTIKMFEKKKEPMEEPKQQENRYFETNQNRIREFRDARDNLTELSKKVKDMGKQTMSWFNSIKFFNSIITELAKIVPKLSDDQRIVLEASGALVGAYNVTQKNWIDSVRAVAGNPLSMTTKKMMQTHPNWFHYVYDKKNKIDPTIVANFLLGWSIFANIILITINGPIDKSSTVDIRDYKSNDLTLYKPIQDNMNLLLKGGVPVLNINYDFFKDESNANVFLDYDQNGNQLSFNWIIDALNKAPKSVALGNKLYFEGDLSVISADLNSMSLETYNNGDDYLNVEYIFPILNVYKKWENDKRYLVKTDLETIGALSNGLSVNGDITDPTFFQTGDPKIFKKWAAFAQILYHLEQSSTVPVSDKICRILQSEIKQ